MMAVTIFMATSSCKPGTGLAKGDGRDKSVMAHRRDTAMTIARIGDGPREKKVQVNDKASRCVLYGHAENEGCATVDDLGSGLIVLKGGAALRLDAYLVNPIANGRAVAGPPVARVSGAGGRLRDRYQL
jgi:hypothetical protein